MTQGLKSAAMAAALLASASGADAQNLKEVGRIAIPGVPIDNFAVLTIDQTSGLGYLAEKENTGVVVFDTKSDSFVKRISGGGLGGNNAKGQLAGPNGVAVVNSGAELWVSDGDSVVRIVDLKTGQVTATIATGGKERANAMGYDPVNGVVLVANSNEDPPYITLISTAPDRKVIAKIPVPESAENIERTVFHAASGMFYTAIPVLARDKTKGIMAQIESKTGQLVKLHELENCHPHSLQIVAEGKIFFGCSSAHGATPKPGGDLAIFDMNAGKIVTRGAGLGGNGGSTINSKLGRYYHSTTAATLTIVDMKTNQPVQQLKTSPGARSVGVNEATGRVYLATTAKDGPCGGCIVVYAPE